MESVAARNGASRPRMLARVEGGALSIWALVAAILLYLAIDGGGYDIVVRSQVGVVVWWVVLIGAVWGLLPAGRVTRLASVALALLGAFVVWTALAVTWSESAERSLQELSRVASYLGILLLAVTVHRDRAQAMRHTVNAVAAAVVVVAGLALASRLRPDLFPAARQTASFLPGAEGRLGWPLNYWNALAALIAIGLPLLLSISTAARTLRGQALAAAGVPILALCGYLTLSRGGAIAAAVALLAFLALAPQRVPKLATVLVTAAGSAALIAGAVNRSAIEHGLVNATARNEGRSLLVALILVCAGVALVQAGVGFAVRHATPPRWTRPFQLTRRPAQVLTAGAVMVCVAVAIAAGMPGRISHAWTDFKHVNAAALQQDSLSRFGSVSGNGRYDYWKAGVNSSSGHLLDGSGPGTYELTWLPHAPYYSYVQDAHSLYVQTFSEDGLIGLILLIGFVVVVLGAAVRLVVRSRYEARVRAAGVAAALVAFCVSAIYEWIWQVPALPAAFLVLAGAVLAPELRGAARRSRQSGVRWPARAGLAALAVACLIAIAVPLATASDVRKSQAAASSGNQALALSDARAAARVEPGAASPQIQLALVLELQGNLRDALAAAHRATNDEPANWSAWLIASRLEAETRHPGASVSAYRRARSLNPQSPLFKQNL